jgi:hypothetical protein
MFSITSSFEPYAITDGNLATKQNQVFACKLAIEMMKNI